MSRPTLQEIEEFHEAVAAGVPADIALAEIWPHETPSVPAFILTQAGADGLLVGWDTCSTCMRHIKLCIPSGCSGPNPPPKLAQWLEEEVAALPPMQWRTKNGRILTEADMEALVDEAERGYDVAKMGPNRVGERTPDVHG